MKILICQPDEALLRKMKNEIEKWLNTCGLSADIYAFSDRLPNGICETAFDIAVLETGKAAPQGLALGRSLADVSPQVQLLYTASGYSDLDAAMSLGAVRYFKHPVSEKRIFEGMTEALRRLRQENVWLNLRTECASVRLPVKDILYIEIKDRKTAIATLNGVYRSVNTLAYWQERLLGEGFAVPHKSYIVNFDGVAKYQRNSHIIMADGTRIAIARGRAAEFHRRFTEYKQKH